MRTRCLPGRAEEDASGFVEILAALFGIIRLILAFFGLI